MGFVKVNENRFWKKKQKTKNSTYEVGILQLLPDRNIIKFDIKVLIHRFQRSRYADVVFELDCHWVVDQCFEEAI